MGDVSQSRYSIVERLTERKLSLMDEKFRASVQAKAQEDKISRLADELSLYEKDSEMKRIHEIERRKSMIEQEKKALARINETSEKTISRLDEQIAEISKAIDSVTEISKTAGSG